MDADQAGMDWSPIHGPATEAVPLAVARLTAIVKTLSDDKREIGMGDVLYDDKAEDPATGTWYDYMTPNALMSGDGSPQVLMQFLALTPNRYVKEGDLGRAGGDFEAILDQMASSVGKDISGMAAQTQAAAVTRWFKATRPPLGMAAYIEDGMAEIERRAGSTQAERFEPLFRVEWKKTFPHLHTLWPHPVDDVVISTAALATSVGFQVPTEGLTPGLLVALHAVVHSLISFVSAGDNLARTAQLVAAFKQKPSDKEGELSKESVAQLQQDSMFLKLKQDVEQCKSGQHVQVARTMLESPHPAGLLFLNAKFAPDAWWKGRAGARTEASIQSVFNEAVSKNTAGKAME